MLLEALHARSFTTRISNIFRRVKWGLTYRKLEQKGNIEEIKTRKHKMALDRPNIVSMRINVNSLTFPV